MKICLEYIVYDPNYNYDDEHDDDVMETDDDEDAEYVLCLLSAIVPCCDCVLLLLSVSPSLPSARQHPSYGDCLEVKMEYYQKSSVLDCVTQCSQSTAHLCEQFLQV